MFTQTILITWLMNLLSEEFKYFNIIYIVYKKNNLFIIKCFY